MNRLKKVFLPNFQIILFIKKKKMPLLLMEDIIKIFEKELSQNIQELLIKKMMKKQIFGNLLLIRQ